MRYQDKLYVRSNIVDGYRLYEQTVDEAKVETGEPIYQANSVATPSDLGDQANMNCRGMLLDYTQR